MILDFLLTLPAILLQGIAYLLPVGGSVPPAFVNGVYTIWSDINAFSFIVPVQTLLTVLGLALTFHLGILSFKLINWLLNKIPGLGS